MGRGLDERPIGSGPAETIEKKARRKAVISFYIRVQVLLVCSFSRLSTPSIVKIINRDNHESLVFVPFQNPLLELVPLLAPNSEYTRVQKVLADPKVPY